MKYKIIVSVSLLMFLFSCSSEQYEKKVESTFANGTTMVEKYYKWSGNEKVVFKEIHYFSNGAKEYEGQYNRHGKKHGTWTTWHDTGTRWLQETYKNGVKDGVFIEWYKSGKKSFEGEYKNGLPNRKWTFWEVDGKKLFTKKYKNGKLLN